MRSQNVPEVLLLTCSYSMSHKLYCATSHMTSLKLDNSEAKLVNQELSIRTEQHHPETNATDP